MLPGLPTDGIELSAERRKKSGSGLFHGDDDTGKKIQNEVSTMIGYPFAEGSKVTVDIASAEFTLFTKGSEAWIEDPAQQPALVDAIRHGDKMTVQGTSRRGTTTIDSYSLAGSGGALEAIAKECPIQ